MKITHDIRKDIESLFPAAQGNPTAEAAVARIAAHFSLCDGEAYYQAELKRRWEEDKAARLKEARTYATREKVMEALRTGEWELWRGASGCWNMNAIRIAGRKTMNVHAGRIESMVNARELVRVSRRCGLTATHYFVPPEMEAATRERLGLSPKAEATTAA